MTPQYAPQVAAQQMPSASPSHSEFSPCLIINVTIKDDLDYDADAEQDEESEQEDLFDDETILPQTYDLQSEAAYEEDEISTAHDLHMQTQQQLQELISAMPVSDTEDEFPLRFYGSSSDSPSHSHGLRDSDSDSSEAGSLVSVSNSSSPSDWSESESDNYETDLEPQLLPENIQHMAPIMFTDASFHDYDDNEMQEWFMADMAPGGCYTHTKRQNNTFDVKTISLSLLDKLVLAYQRYDQCQPCTPLKASRSRNSNFFATVQYHFASLSHDMLVIKPKASASATAPQPETSATTSALQPEEAHNEFDEQENFLTDEQMRNVASEGSTSTTDTDISETLPYNPPVLRPPPPPPSALPSPSLSISSTSSSTSPSAPTRTPVPPPQPPSLPSASNISTEFQQYEIFAAQARATGIQPPPYVAIYDRDIDRAGYGICRDWMTSQRQLHK